MWLLVAMCTTGVVLLWLPGFFNSIWDFSDALGKKGQVSKNAFLDNLKEVQAEFERNLNKQSQSLQQATSTPPLAPLSEQDLKNISKELESFAQQEDKQAEVGITSKHYCSRKGGAYRDQSGINGSVYGVCAFTDGSECHALLFLRGKCHIGQYAKAEDGIPKWPDLTLDVHSMEYCRRIDSELKTVSRDQARGICIDGVSIQNVGIAASAKAQLDVDGKRYAIPALKPQETFAVSSPIIVQKTSDPSDVSITIQTSFQEIDKENNTYHYAAKTK